MSERKDGSEEEHLTPEEILRGAVREAARLERESSTALDNERDVVTYNRKLRERANLIVGLPRRMEVARERGNIFPEDALEQLRGWSQLAVDALDADKTGFRLSILLQVGSRRGEPNALEKLIDQVYPPKIPPARPH